MLKARAGCVEANGTVTDIGLMHILELASLGHSVLEIARYLRVSKGWLQKRLDPESDLFDENVYAVYSDGEHEFAKRLRNAQANLADVNATMAIHLGKQYLGQTDKQEIAVTKTVHIVGTLPDYAQTPEQWRAQFGPQGAAAQVALPVRRLEAVDVEATDATE